MTLQLLKKKTTTSVNLAKLFALWLPVNIGELEKWAETVDLTTALPIYQSLLKKNCLDLASLGLILWTKIQVIFKN